MMAVAAAASVAVKGWSGPLGVGRGWLAGSGGDCPGSADRWPTSLAGPRPAEPPAPYHPHPESRSSRETLRQRRNGDPTDVPVPERQVDERRIRVRIGESVGILHNKLCKMYKHNYDRYWHRKETRATSFFWSSKKSGFFRRWVFSVNPTFFPILIDWIRIQIQNPDPYSENRSGSIKC